MIVIISFLPAALGLTVYAEEKQAGIELQSNVGYQGAYKDGRWYPVRLTLTNETGSDLSGDLVLSYLNGDNRTTDEVVPLELPQGSPIQVTIGVPGINLNKDTNRITFYKDGYRGKDSKQVQLTGRGYLESRNTLQYMIGVVSRDPDTFNFMPQLNQRGYDIAVYPLQPEELPVETHLLDSLDTIVINDMGTVDWNEDLVQALKDWVARGGNLVLAGGAGYAQTAAAFSELSPVEVKGTTKLTSAASLAAAGGEELSLPQGITVSTGDLESGMVMIAEGDIPLAVNAEHGFGQVIYAAFDPSLEPLASWAGSAMLWAKLLGSTLSPLQHTNGGIGFNSYMNDYWQLNSLLDLFPSIKQPDLLLMIVMFGLYILIIAPVLYIVLSKADRREWAWWLIPVLSLAMGVTVFLIGAGDKRNVAAHTIEIIELSKDGHAVAMGGTAIFTPTGGTVSALIEKAVPLRMYGGSGAGGGLNLNGQYQLRSGREETKVTWRSVPYWSTRKLWFDRRLEAAEEIGSLNVTYEYDKTAPRLVVTNDTHSDLTDIHYLDRGLVLNIGDLKRGESGEIVLSSAPISGISYYNYGSSIYPYPVNNRQDDVNRRQRELIDMYFNRYNGSLLPVGPLVVGFSTDHNSPYVVNGETVRSDQLRLWVKELPEAGQEEGRVLVPSDAIAPIITSNLIQSYVTHGDGSMQVGVGEMELEYMVPDGYGVAYDKLDIQFPKGSGNPNAIWSIWHESKGEWKELSSSSLEEPAQYLTAAQSIRIKLVTSAESVVWMPQLTLEGEVLQR